MRRAFLNRIGTAVPPHDVHAKFIDFAPSLLGDDRARRVFLRMAERSGIEHRYSFFEPHPDPAKIDALGFYARGRFPDTGARMRFFEEHAFRLVRDAVEALQPGRVTHLILSSCTGFYAPGPDLQLIAKLGLDAGIERTVVGFMGCQAALNALKLARHIVRSEDGARVLTLSLELCTLHLQETGDLEEVLSFLLFGDGCAACLVTAEPEGIELERFATAMLPDSAGLITWKIGSLGFDMRLSGEVPQAIGRDLRAAFPGAPEELALWAVHPGGRTVLDAVERGLGLDEAALRPSRDVLRRYGNMSSPTVLFVLKETMAQAPRGCSGCALAFGPGLTAETLFFRIA